MLAPSQTLREPSAGELQTSCLRLRTSTLVAIVGGGLPPLPLRALGRILDTSTRRLPLVTDDVYVNPVGYALQNVHKRIASPAITLVPVSHLVNGLADWMPTTRAVRQRIAVVA